MKATLEYNLPEDQDDFELATKGGKWYGVVWQMDQWLRAQNKYMPDDTYFEVRQKLREIMNDNGVSLDDVS